MAAVIRGIKVATENVFCRLWILVWFCNTDLATLTCTYKYQKVSVFIATFLFVCCLLVFDETPL